MTEPSLEQEIDRLYSLSLTEFIGARNELAKRLQTAGDRDATEEIKKLPKPSVTAWAVNALYHHERERFDALLAAAAAVRAALAGEGDRRQAEAAKRRALGGLLGRAAEHLSNDGHASTPATRQRIRHTLETLAARDPAADGPRPGRLTADLEPQGFDVLAGLAASLPPTAPAARDTRTPTRTATGKGAKPPAAARDERLEAARQKLEEQETALARLEQDVEEADAAAAEASKGATRLAEEAAEATRLAKAAANAAAAARKELATARAAATKARAARRRGLTRVATARRRVERQEA